MIRRSLGLAAVAGLAMNCGIGIAAAQIGEPIGSFEITVRQGGSIVASDVVSIGPGGELADLKAAFQDGDPEDFTQIGDLGPAGSQTPIILKVTSDGGVSESFRVLHFYIDAPVSLDDIHSPSPYSLFDPLGGDIDVTITSLEFDGGVLVAPFLVDNDTYLTSFLRDYQGHFYESTGANAYNAHGHGMYDIQVPGEKYLDGDASLYNFSILGTGGSVSWSLDDIDNPGLTTNVNNGLGVSLTPLVPGYVFELGLSMAFIVVPEPSTAALLMFGALFLIRRR